MIKSFISIIKNKHFRILWLAQITSQIALNMLSFVLAIRVYQETQSNTAVSLMFLSFGIPAIVFGIVAGGIVDYFDKRMILIVCNCVRVLLFILFFLFWRELFALYALSVAISLVTQLFIPAEAPSIPQLVPSEKLLAANSLFAISFYLSTVLGFILAGPLIRIFGFHNVYLVMGFLMMLAFFFVFSLPPIRPRGKSQFSFQLSFIATTISGGLRFIKSSPRITQSLILMTFSQALLATLAVLAPGFADRVLTIDLTDASYLVMGPAALGLVAGALLVGIFGAKFLKGTLILIGILATGLVLLFLSLITRADSPSISFSFPHIQFTISNLFLAMLFLFLLGMFNSFMSVPANTILQQETKSNMRGRVYGVLTSLTGGVSFLPVVFSGILADVIGVGRTLFIIGIIILTAGGYHYLQRRDYHTTIN